MGEKIRDDGGEVWVAAVDPGVAGLLTAVGTILGLGVKAGLDYRKDRAIQAADREEKSHLVRNETLASYLEGYQRLVEDLTQENSRLRQRISECEERLSSLQREMQLLRRERRGKVT